MKTLMARLLLVALVALLPAFGVAVHDQIEQRSLRWRATEDEARRLVTLVAAEQLRIAEGAEQVLDAIAATYAGLRLSPAECPALFSDLIARSSRYVFAAVADLSGDIICSQGMAPIGGPINLADRSYFRLALQTKSYSVGEFAIGRMTGVPSLHFGRPLSDRQGNITGVAAVGLSLPWLQEQLGRLDLPAGAVVSLRDRNGALLARQPAELEFGSGLPTRLREVTGQTGVDVALVEGLDGRARILAAQTLTGGLAGLRIAVALDRDRRFMQETEANRRDLIYLAAALGLGLVATILAGRRLISRPAAALLAAADRWRVGDLGARTGLRPGTDEFGRLAAAFDKMAAAFEARDRTLQTTLENITDAVVVIDQAWRVTYVNQNALALIGQGPGVIGLPAREVFIDSLYTPFGRAAMTAMKRHERVRLVEWHKSLCRRIDACFSPLPEGIAVFCRDVTEEHRTTSALRDSEQRYRAIFEQAAVGIATLDLSGRFLSLNDRLCKITGYDRDTLLASCHVDIVHPDDCDELLRLTGRVQSGSVMGDTARIRYGQNDGSVVHSNVTISLLRDSNGVPDRTLLIVEDTTDRQHMEDTLRASEARFSLALDAAGFGTWELDVLDCAHWWSETQWRLRGQQPRREAPTMKELTLGIHPDDIARVDAEMRGAIADPKRQYDCEYRVILPDGSTEWILSKGIVVRDALGAPVRVIGLSMDITLRHEREDDLRRIRAELEARLREETAAREAARMQAMHAERLRSLGQLAAGVAHDFNNILQMVLANAELIRTDPDDTAGVLVLADQIIEAAERGGKTSSRMLAYARKSELRAGALDIHALLEGLKGPLATSLGAAVRLETHVPAGLPALLADRSELETAFINLGTNARDAMPNGGTFTISVAAENVAAGDPPPVDGLQPGRYLRITVSDTGVGMPPEVLARADQPFFTTKEVGRGTGLGLATLRSFAEQSGGAMRLESTPGRGTTVTLWLPCADAVPGTNSGVDDAAPFVAPAPDTSARPKRILVVDDEEMLRRLVRRFLEVDHYEVLDAADGAAALELLRQSGPVDLLLTDMSMPGMNGQDLIQEARVCQPGLPALLITGHLDDGGTMVSQMQETGPFAVIRKPVRGDALVASVRAIVATQA